jgi:hypothetical protein
VKEVRESGERELEREGEGRINTVKDLRAGGTLLFEVLRGGEAAARGGGEIV